MVKEKEHKNAAQNTHLKRYKRLENDDNLMKTVPKSVPKMSEPAQMDHSRTNLSFLLGGGATAEEYSESDDES